MNPLSTNLRNKLERTIVEARDVAETGVKAALEALAVHHHEPYGHMSPEDRKLRNHLRARARQLGDKQNPKGELEITHLGWECAYEHWHRMLFARFLAENDLLIEPEMGVAISLEECEELAKEDGKDLWTLASEFAQRMLPQIFRPNDPVLKVNLAREHRLKLENLLDSLEPAIFKASDSLGWVYQFWQSKRKKEVNQSGNKIGADELPAVTQLFTEPYMVSFLLDNSLGAWWAARCDAGMGRRGDGAKGIFERADTEEEIRKACAIPGVPLEYLRFVRLPSPTDTGVGDAPLPSPSETAVGDLILPSPSGEDEQPFLPSPSGEDEQPFLPSPSGRGAGGEGKKELIPADILKNARKLRKNQTDAEQLLWALLRDRRFLGKKFRRQHPIGRHILDFYCHEEKLAVEIDGGQHNAEDQRQYDDKRTAFLKEKGIRVIRFWNNEVLQQTESVLEALYLKLSNKSSPPSPLTPLPKGEGKSGGIPLAEGAGQGVAPPIFPGREGLMWSPAAGTFDNWPERLSELKVLDPCCGSGHFLVAAFLMLVTMRTELDGLSARDACDAVLRENLHGLEIDKRCVELAAFSLALTAWTYPDIPSPSRREEQPFLTSPSGRGVGGEGVKPIGYRPLPELNLACTGLSINVSKAGWKNIASALPDKSYVPIALDWLYEEFQNAPVLGSLIDPSRGKVARLVQWDALIPALKETLDREKDSEVYETGVTAQGLAKATQLLSAKYHWVITNVPYLVRGKQSEVLKSFCEKHYVEGKNDLATVFLDRCLDLCKSSRGLEPPDKHRQDAAVTTGTVSIVLPQNWLFLTTYKKFREKLLKNDTWHLIARLGPGAFETISGEVVKAILVTMSRETLTPKPSPKGRGEQALPHLRQKNNQSFPPLPVGKKQSLLPLPVGEQQSFLPLPMGEGRGEGNMIRGLDVSQLRTAAEKAAGLLTAEIKSVEQAKQLQNPDARVTLEEAEDIELLEKFANGFQGIASADYPRFGRCYWELSKIDGRQWIFQQSTVNDTTEFGGKEHVLYWENGKGELSGSSSARVQGLEAWSKWGIAASQMREITVTLHTASSFDNNTAAIIPHNPIHLPAIWCFCSSLEYNEAVRQIDQSLKVTNATLVKVPFDLDHWTKVAAEKYPNGLPKSYSDDPTQWIFHGHPCGSVVWDEKKKWAAIGPLRRDETMLQVAVARLMGYRWPAEVALTPTLTPDPSPRGRGEGRNSEISLKERIQENDPLLLGEGGRRPGEGEMELSDEQWEWVKKCDELLRYADEDGIVCIPSVRGEEPAADRMLSLLSASYESSRRFQPADKNRQDAAAGLPTSAYLDDWLRDHFFEQHCKLFHHRPFIWHIWDGRRRDGFHVLVNYHKLAEGNSKGRQLLENLTYSYLGDWITRQREGVKRGEGGAEDRLAAALELQNRLIAIIEGEPPFDVFVRWKPIEEQPIGWEPDINDGVRLNIRPFLAQDIPGGRKGAGILRWKPNIKWEKDRGKEPFRLKEQYPWFWKDGEFTGDRVNDIHLTNEEKRQARVEANRRKGEWVKR